MAIIKKGNWEYIKIVGFSENEIQVHKYKSKTVRQNKWPFDTVVPHSEGIEWLMKDAKTAKTAGGTVYEELYGYLYAKLKISNGFWPSNYDDDL